MEHKGKNNYKFPRRDAIKLLLILSHGQASVERGFSINKGISCENNKKQSLIERRIIRDHINTVGGVINFKIDKSVIYHFKASRQRYQFHLDALNQEDRQQLLKSEKQKMLK